MTNPMNEPDLTRVIAENPHGFVRNCLIAEARPSDPVLFYQRANGDNIAYLDGYVITPKECYEALRAIALRASEARAQALEEAAKVCEEHANGQRAGVELHDAVVRDKEALECAAAIRALKDQSVSDDAAARRKLEALREPTEEMLDAACNEMQEPPWIRGVERIDVRRIYRAMIDAAIREKQ